MDVDWREDWHQMDVFTMFYTCRYCIFTLCVGQTCSWFQGRALLKINQFCKGEILCQARWLSMEENVWTLSFTKGLLLEIKELALTLEWPRYCHHLFNDTFNVLMMRLLRLACQIFFDINAKYSVVMIKCDSVLSFDFPWRIVELSILLTTDNHTIKLKYFHNRFIKQSTVNTLILPWLILHSADDVY